MKKTLSVCMLLIAIVLSLAACVGNNNPPSNNETPHTHSFGEWEVTVKPTCTNDGTKVRYCSCGEKQSEIIVALGHTPAEATIENKVDATYETDGSYNKVVHCSTCNEKLSETSHTIPMLKHTPADAVEENRIEATCYAEGSYDMVVYCTECGEELERIKYIIPVVDENEKQVPIYKGMSITDIFDNSSNLNYRLRFSLLSKGINNNGNGNNNGNNGNHYGNYKGDTHDNKEDIDYENPFAENGNNENIEEEINGTLEIIGSDIVRYYAVPNQDIYINIHISNPDNYEILSFTLNGKKYSSYMFEYGSDMETIVLKYNVGDASGLVEYTIDAIKYIDGDEIKDVIIDGDKTVKAGIKTEDQVAANVINSTITPNSATFIMDISDKDNLIELSNGTLKAVLYDGDSIVAEQDLLVGQNSIHFEGLKTNTLYQYAVVGSYDDLSGEGVRANIIFKDAFYSEAIVLFDNIVITQQSISFDFYNNPKYSSVAPFALKLYKDEILISDFSGETTIINDLLSATTYVLVAEYLNQNENEKISIEFTTLTNVIPEITISVTNITTSSLGFLINESDPYDIGKITKIELMHQGNVIETESMDQMLFENLLSNNTYTIKVTYAYNLNDGNGEQICSKEQTVTTAPKSIPTVNVSKNSLAYNYAKFDLNIQDKDCTISKIVSKLYFDKRTEVFSEKEHDSTCTFDNLLFSLKYKMVTTIYYNLGDGTQDKSLIIETKFQLPNYVDEQGIVYQLDGAIYNITEKSWTSLAKVYDYEGSSQSISIPDTILNYEVTSILDYAFSNCKTLKNVVVPKTVRGIGYGAFYDCDNLESITIPFVGEGDSSQYENTHFGYIFGADTYLTQGGRMNEGFIPGNLKEVIITGTNYSYGGIYYSNQNYSGNYIAENAFYNCKLIEKIVIPNCVIYIGDGAFYGCDELKSITIPFTGREASPTYNHIPTHFGSIFGAPSYSEQSMYIPPSLETVILTETVDYIYTTVKDYAFYDCAWIQKIILPATIIWISDGAFTNCHSLSSVTIPESVTSIGWYAFNGCYSLKSITIPSGVTRIGDGVFNACESLENVVFEGNITHIGDSAFCNCDSLKSIVIPESVVKIDDWAFKSCDNLASIIIPDSVTTIGIGVFSSCNSLTSITIGNGVTTIGERAFRNSDSLKDVYYTGSEEKWAKITIGSDNSNLKNATIHFNYIPEE